MNKILLCSALLLLPALVVVQVAPAGMINYERRNKRAGTPTVATNEAPVKAMKPSSTQNNTATTSTATVTPAPASAYGVPADPMIRNSYEKKFDLNLNGKLDPAEARAILNSVVKEVGTTGEARLESEVLKPYDRNSDGMITSDELSKILRDLDN